MLILFGTKSSRVKTKALKGNFECPNCKSKNSLITTTLAKYFHIFWIPIFPLSKSNHLICSSCNVDFYNKHLTGDIKEAQDRDNMYDPPKRPIWHGCGCLIIVFLFILTSITSFLSYLFLKDDINDIRMVNLTEDFQNVTSNPSETLDSISYHLQSCINQYWFITETDEFKYFSRVNDGKLLILLNVGELKEFDKENKRNLLDVVEHCIDNYMNMNYYSKYIGIKGGWRMILIKTPFSYVESSLNLKETPLLLFYNESYIPPLEIELKESKSKD